MKTLSLTVGLMLGWFCGACGSSSDAGTDGKGGGGASSGGTPSGQSGSKNQGGSSKGGAASNGGSEAGSSAEAGSPSESGGEGGTSGSGGGGSSGSGGSSSGDCELEDAVVSCVVDSGDGVRLCSEVYLEGTPADVTRSNCGGTIHEGEHCPSGPNLVGYCKGGISTYYYAPPNNQIWAAAPNSCPALMGTWCGQ